MSHNYTLKPIHPGIQLNHYLEREGRTEEIPEMAFKAGIDEDKFRRFLMGLVGVNRKFANQLSNIPGLNSQDILERYKRYESYRNV